MFFQLFGAYAVGHDWTISFTRGTSRVGATEVLRNSKLKVLHKVPARGRNQFLVRVCDQRDHFWRRSYFGCSLVYRDNSGRTVDHLDNFGCRTSLRSRGSRVWSRITSIFKYICAGHSTHLALEVHGASSSESESIWIIRVQYFSAQSWKSRLELDH